MPKESLGSKMDLTFITSNADKATYLANYLDIPLSHHRFDLPEIQSLDLEEIVIHKARAAFKLIKKPVLVEDVSLVFTSFKDLPGPLIKWFLRSLGKEGLCRILDPYPVRTALARVNFCLYDGQKSQIFAGEMLGSISSVPIGKAGFGWDPIFIPKGSTKTWAEMTSNQKHQTSMRKIALEKLKEFIQEAA